MILDYGFKDLARIPPLPQDTTRLYCEDNRLVALPVLPKQVGMVACSWNRLTAFPVCQPHTLLACCHNVLSTKRALCGALFIRWGEDATRYGLF